MTIKGIASLLGVSWVLLQNSEQTRSDKEAKDRLEQALAIKKKLAQAYYLKEELREIWSRIDKQSTERQLMDWVHKARSTTIEVLKNMTVTLLGHRFGILVWYDHHISTGKVEGINNKIKTMKRQAYGYRDTAFFKIIRFCNPYENLRIYRMNPKYHFLQFDSVPQGGIFLLQNLNEGSEILPFRIINGKQEFFYDADWKRLTEPSESTTLSDKESVNQLKKKGDVFIK